MEAYRRKAVLPATHVVAPVQPVPPHCAYLAAPPDEDELVLVGGETGVDVDAGLVLVDSVVDGEAGLLEEGDEPPPEELLPGPDTEVVIDPDSMYTPLKYQSSGPLSPLEAIGRRRTPRCQSAPF
ncbi:MAG: hypothetical protein M1820_007055 [Bogoriella megaspora]|nr:MAG: hypothetical protein M1820_007055 [Bogoriella megaspora]